MKKYIKKDVSKETVKSLHDKYNIDYLEASIFARRGITQGQDLLYYLEDDTRFLHQSFLFKNMETCVERIKEAIETKEKILIFGDKDVDGVTSTAILYTYLKSRGALVSYRLPVGEDAYGLSMQAVSDFHNEGGNLIITVDCGISNHQEVLYARQNGIDVIVTDHHNPPENLPEAYTIIDPKLKDSGYPFVDISGAAVAFKITEALRLSETDLYGKKIAILNVKETDSSYILGIIRHINLVENGRMNLTISKKDKFNLSSSPLCEFLSGYMLYVWDKEIEDPLLRKILGNNADFTTVSLRDECSSIIKNMKTRTVEDIIQHSKIRFYKDGDFNALDALYNVFVTYSELYMSLNYNSFVRQREDDLQLVSIAALADIMPLKNENRIFVKAGLKYINSPRIRKGLSELIAKTERTSKNLTSQDLSWKIIPSLNAAGRMGKSIIALELLISDDPKERLSLSDKIKELNEMRKIYVQDGERVTLQEAKDSFKELNGKLCVVINEKINRGITGILASKIVQAYNVPSLAITYNEDKSILVGSMRSIRGLVATDFLDSFGEGFFENHGGHNAAAGFNFKATKLPEFKAKLKALSKTIVLKEENDSILVDAELPEAYITPNILKLLDKFEPFGEQNPELIFLSNNLKINDTLILGKTERQHLKITFETGAFKFPALFWGQAERLNRDFTKLDKLNIIYNITKNYFNGNITPQMILMDVEKAR